MSFKKQLLEPVIDLLRRGILIGIDFVYDNPFLRSHLIFRKHGTCHEFEKQGSRLVQILFKDSGMNDYFLLCSIGVEFPSQTVET